MTLTPEQLAELTAAIIGNETTLDYAGLSARLGVSVMQCRRLVSARKIKPILSGARTVRFHWPSVVKQLQKGI